jgi:hypothetical protein
MLLLTIIKSVFVGHSCFYSQKKKVVVTSVQTGYPRNKLIKSVLESDKTAPTCWVDSAPYQNLTGIDIGPLSQH